MWNEIDKVGQPKEDGHYLILVSDPWGIEYTFFCGMTISEIPDEMGDNVFPMNNDKRDDRLQSSSGSNKAVKAWIKIDVPEVPERYTAYHGPL